MDDTSTLLSASTSTPLPGLTATSSRCPCGRAGSAGPAATLIASRRPATEVPVSASPSLPVTPAASLPSPTAPACDPTITYCIESGHFLLERPSALPATMTIDPSYPYGSTQNGTRQPHHGVEFYNASGTPVLAAADGVVIVAGDDKGGPPYSPSPNFYGNLIVLEHHLPGINQPVYTLYGHLSKIEAQTGQNVRAGEKIGEVGAIGAAIGSHLHFEVRLGENNYDSTRNPVLWLKPLRGENGNPDGLIAGRFMDEQGNPLYYSNLNVQYFPEVGGPQAAAYAVETYAPEKHPVRGDDRWHENFSLGTLPTGHYRISYIWAGVLYERWVEVQPGKLTIVTFIVK
ncbi:MAG: peptidoglycan DD-metalloendopeptidase family protein [Chloroflexi bacterium]|nr:peptidoglycan DD-metalloendopeptidase family protein [Chloroflexota bacterium]